MIELINGKKVADPLYTGLDECTPANLAKLPGEVVAPANLDLGGAARAPPPCARGGLMALLELNAISKHFGAIQALADVSLALAPGEVVGLMGDNGAGKSTLVRIIAGNFPPSAGTMSMRAGRSSSTARPTRARPASRSSTRTWRCATTSARRRTSSSAASWCAASGRCACSTTRRCSRRAGELFAELKSETRPRDLVRRMSGGQRQAVAIARTRLSEPKIVLMDEPTAAISVRQVAEVLNLIRHLRDQGIAVVLISHRMPDVFGVADRIVVMRRGSKVADKPASRQFARGSDRADHRRHRERLSMEARQPHCCTSRRTAPASTATIAAREHHGVLAWLISQQTFWVSVAAVIAFVVLSLVSDVFATQQNLFNVTRNFAFVAIIAIGMTAVIITGGIDLSVGAVLVLSGMVIGMTMNAGMSIWLAVPLALGAALAVGAFNGVLIAYVGVPSFVVTLGTLSIARSLAMVLSNNRMVYEFGPDQPQLLCAGRRLHQPAAALRRRGARAQPGAVPAARAGRRRLRAALDTLGPASVRHRRQRARRAAHRRAGAARQGQRLHVLQPHRRHRRHPRGGLARHHHHQPGPGHGTVGHRRGGDRRCQPERRRQARPSAQSSAQR